VREPVLTARSMIIPLKLPVVNGFTRKDLETFARVQYARELPAGVTLAPKPEFTFALAENRAFGSPFSHVMRVSAKVLA